MRTCVRTYNVCMRVYVVVRVCETVRVYVAVRSVRGGA